jgi:hypothetical protein
MKNTSRAGAAACAISLWVLQTITGCSRAKQVTPEPPSDAVGPMAPSDGARTDTNPVVLATVGQATSSAAAPTAKQPAWRERAEAVAKSLNGNNATQLLNAVAGLASAEASCYEALAYYAMTQILAADVERDRCLPNLDAQAQPEWQARLTSARQAASTNFDQMLQRAVANGCSKAIGDYPGGVGGCSTCVKVQTLQADLSSNMKHVDVSAARALLRSTKIETKPFKFGNVEPQP